MGNFLINMLNRHRGQIASVKPRPIHRYEDHSPKGQTTVAKQPQPEAGWEPTRLDSQMANRRSSLTDGYHDEKKSDAVSPGSLSHVSPRTSAQINQFPPGGQSVGIYKNGESGSPSNTNPLNPTASGIKNGLLLKDNSKNESRFFSAAIDSPALLDSTPYTQNKRPVTIGSVDSSQPKEMRYLFPKPPVTPDKTLIGSTVPIKVQPISTIEGQTIDSLHNNSSELRESSSLGSQKTGWAMSNTPGKRSSSKQEVPPAVHVTIGRIEVRATSPPQATAGRDRPPKSGPLLSLNDYLNRRSAKNQ